MALMVETAEAIWELVLVLTVEAIPEIFAPSDDEAAATIVLVLVLTEVIADAT